jgi:hypothetical protein
MYICISVLMHYDCTTQPILPFITITTKFLSKHCIKRLLDTEMNGYQFYRKTFLWSVDPKQPKMSNLHSDLSLKLSQGEVHDFSGSVQKLSGEMQNDLRGGVHLPTPSLKIRLCAMPLSVVQFSFCVLRFRSGQNPGISVAYVVWRATRSVCNERKCTRSVTGLYYF